MQGQQNFRESHECEVISLYAVLDQQVHEMVQHWNITLMQPESSLQVGKASAQVGSCFKRLRGDSNPQGLKVFLGLERHNKIVRVFLGGQ